MLLDDETDIAKDKKGKDESSTLLPLKAVSHHGLYVLRNGLLRLSGLIACGEIDHSSVEINKTIRSPPHCRDVLSSIAVYLHLSKFFVGSSDTHSCRVGERMKKI